MRICDARRGYSVLALLLCFVFTIPASADKLKTDTSLAWAPKSAGFYFTLLNQGETMDRFWNSNAYARLKSLPIIQMGTQQLMSQWESDSGPSADIREFLGDPENAGLIELAKQCWRDEFFMLGDKNVAELIYLANDFNRQNQQSQIAMVTGGDVDPDDLKNAMIDNAIKAVEDMDVPNIIFGFKVKDSALASKQVGRMAALLREAMGEEPELAAMLKEKEIEGSKFAQMSFSGDMIPWDEALESQELEESQIERLQKAVSGRSVHVTFGVHQDYFMFVVGSINNPLKLFKAKNLLYDRPEFERVRSMEGKKFTTVSYASEEFMKKASRPQDDIDSFSDMAAALIPQAELEEDLESDLQADIKELASDLKSVIPENGAVVAFEYQVEGGYEGYSQNWAENLTLDGSKKLDILKHVGGNPLVVMAARMNVDSPAKGLVSKWFGKAMSYGERFAMREEPDEDDLELYESFKNALAPFGGRFAKATEDHMAKAMNDGQVAMILDSKLEAKTQWHPMMPASDEPLGMFEFAQVYGVADKAELETAFEQYRTIANAAIDKIKEVTQENQEALMERLEGQAQMLPMVISQLRLPTPRSDDSVESGKLFFLGTFQQVGLDAEIAPSMGWSDDVLVMSNTPDVARRILAEKSISGPLSDETDRELAAARYINVEGVMEMVKPWVSYGLNVAAEQQDNEMISMAIPQVETIIDVMKCFRQHTSVIYIEDDSMVSFYRNNFSDLE